MHSGSPTNNPCRRRPEHKTYRSIQKTRQIKLSYEELKRTIHNVCSEVIYQRSYNHCSGTSRH